MQGVPIGFDAMARIDLIVCGTVAVNRTGVRIGKGGGYSDLEFALAREAGVIGDWTTVATTVHDLQVLDEDLPETPHDFRVDLIITPESVIQVSGRGGLRGHRESCGRISVTRRLTPFLSSPGAKSRARTERIWPIYTIDDLC